MQFRSNGYRLLKGRHTQIGRIYAITAVTEQRRPMFSDFYLGRLVVEQIRAQHEAGLIHSLAWVVMPDHFHWLVELHNCDLPRLMRITKSRSARAINQARCSFGTLWQKGYFDRALRREEDLKAMARYIVANPLRAGLVKHIGQYPLWDAIWL